MNYHDDERLEALARQFVLGTMSRRARRRFSQLVDRDERIESQVLAIEAELSPLAWSLTPVPPSALVWRRIRRQMDRNPIRKPTVGRWRLASGALAVALAAVTASWWQLYTRAPERIVETIVETQVVEPAAGVVTNADGQALWFVQLFDDGRAEINVEALPDAKPDNDYQLWVLRDDGVPVSLGLLPQSGSRTLVLGDQARSGLASGRVLAVSLEPIGGSPEAVPTGPVLFTAPIVGT